jgi:hypothetical protein
MDTPITSEQLRMIVSVVRVRAVMHAPTRWRVIKDQTGRSYTRAAGKALDAFVAVSYSPDP